MENADWPNINSGSTTTDSAKWPSTNPNVEVRLLRGQFAVVIGLFRPILSVMCLLPILSLLKKIVNPYFLRWFYSQLTSGGVRRPSKLILYHKRNHIRISTNRCYILGITWNWKGIRNRPCYHRGGVHGEGSRKGTSPRLWSRASAVRKHRTNLWMAQRVSNFCGNDIWPFNSNLLSFFFQHVQERNWILRRKSRPSWSDI